MFQLFYWLCCCFAHSMVTDITKRSNEHTLSYVHNDTLTHTYELWFQTLYTRKFFCNYGAYLHGCWLFNTLCCLGLPIFFSNFKFIFPFIFLSFHFEATLQNTLICIVSILLLKPRHKILHDDVMSPLSEFFSYIIIYFLIRFVDWNLHIKSG